MSEPEKNSLRKYVEGGGFIVMEQFALAKEQSASGSTFKRMVQKSIGAEGIGD